MQALQKKVILPVSISTVPELLGMEFDISFRKINAKIHFPISSKHNDKVGINAPLLPPAPYDTGVLKMMDKGLAGGWLQWGANSSIENGSLSSVSVGGIILTLDGDFETRDEARTTLNAIESKFLEWYRVFGAWLDLLSCQDLNTAEPDSFISKNTMNDLWSVRVGKEWSNAGPDVIYLTTDIKSKKLMINEAMVREAIKRADKGDDVSTENKLLMDARHRFNREDYNGSCLYYGQYIEVTARRKIIDYFDSQEIGVEISNAFLENKAIYDLLDSCKKFSIDINLTNKQRGEVCKIRNLTAHARQSLTLHYAQEMETYANKVFEVSQPADLYV
ncbi:MAG: hypothetical protein JWM81_409 [Candidatus Saccharibacteria bacterium]|nr:hypothetical protein [Candidatus Saccharibacteria bacterium]